MRQWGVLKASHEPSYIEMLDFEDKVELLTYVGPFLISKWGEVQAEKLNLKGLYAAYIGGHFLKGMDYWLLNFFKGNGYTIQGLESCEQVSSFFEDPDFDNFQQIIKHKAGFSSEDALKLEADYLSGILPCEEDMEFDEECKQRNESWFPKLMAYHAQYLETLLVAVGYRHLLGKEGLLEQLSSAGFSLRRMTAEGEFLPYKLQDEAVKTHLDTSKPSGSL